jgi:hypothetical protein
MFYLFYTDHMQYRFFVKLYERIWIMELYMWNFSSKFVDTLKYVFFSIGSIYTWEPNWISTNTGKYFAISPWTFYYSVFHSEFLISLLSILPYPATSCRPSVGVGGQVTCAWSPGFFELLSRWFTIHLEETPNYPSLKATQNSHWSFYPFCFYFSL